MTSQVARADALHCPHRGVKCRDDRSAFFPYDQVTDQIEAINISCARLIEHRAVAIKGNSQCVQEVGRRCTSEREYHAIKETGCMFGFSENNTRPSCIVLDLFDV